MHNENPAYQVARQVHEDHAVPVFPVKLSLEDTGKWQKTPLLKWGSTSGHPDDVPWNGANAVGVPMGQRSGLLAIDLDTYKDGSEAEAWVEKHDLPVTRTHRTASGGRHLIFRLPEGSDFGNKAPKVPGLDVRGSGGYIVWADTGGLYLVEVDMAPAVLPASVCDELAALQSRSSLLDDRDLPPWTIVDIEALEARLDAALLDPLRPELARRFNGSVEGLSDRSASARDMSVAGLLAPRGFTYSEIVTVLLEYFPHGTAAREDRPEQILERAAKRCAARAVLQVQDRDAKRMEAMQACFAKFRTHGLTQSEPRSA